MSSLDLVFAGVGGQGTVLASRALGTSAIRLGYEVRTSETIGMAQREGCVVSHVRIGHGLTGSLVPDGGAAALIAFELAEAARSGSKLKPGGLLLVNSARIVPVTVSLGQSTYDEPAIRGYLEALTPELHYLDATAAAGQAGSVKATNAVMLGALAGSGVLPFSPGEVLASLLELVPSKARDLNRTAFDLGREAMAGSRRAKGA